MGFYLNQQTYEKNDTKEGKKRDSRNKGILFGYLKVSMTRVGL